MLRNVDIGHVVLLGLLIIIVMASLRTSHRRRFRFTLIIERAKSDQTESTGGTNENPGRPGRRGRRRHARRLARWRWLYPPNDDDDAADVHDDHDDDPAMPERAVHDQPEHRANDDLDLDDDRGTYDDVLDDDQLHEHVDNLVEHGPGDHDYGPQFDEHDDEHDAPADDHHKRRRFYDDINRRFYDVDEHDDDDSA